MKTALTYQEGFETAAGWVKISKNLGISLTEKAGYLMKTTPNYQEGFETGSGRESLEKPGNFPRRKGRLSMKTALTYQGGVEARVGWGENRKQYGYLNLIFLVSVSISVSVSKSRQSPSQSHTKITSFLRF